MDDKLTVVVVVLLVFVVIVLVAILYASKRPPRGPVIIITPPLDAATNWVDGPLGWELTDSYGTRQPIAWSLGAADKISGELQGQIRRVEATIKTTAGKPVGLTSLTVNLGTAHVLVLKNVGGNLAWNGNGNPWTPSGAAVFDWPLLAREVATGGTLVDATGTAFALSDIKSIKIWL